MMRIVSLASVALVACIPVGVPPIRANIGLTRHEGSAVGTRIDVGTALGSLVEKEDLPIDVGAGFLFDVMPKTDSGMDRSTHGNYIDAGVVVRRWGFARLLAGARYEKYSSGSLVNDVKARVDFEILDHVESTFSDSDAAGGAYGNAGVGVYAEAGPAWNTDGEVGWTATAGLSVRLPAIGALFWGVPGSGGSVSILGAHR